MITGEQAVTNLVSFLTRFSKYEVYKFDDCHEQRKQYIAVHHQLWLTGKPVNDDNVININIHAPMLASGRADRDTMLEMLHYVESMIPYGRDDEDFEPLFLGGAYYSIISVSNPVEDKSDKTYFYNVRVKVVFYN